MTSAVLPNKQKQTNKKPVPYPSSPRVCSLRFQLHEVATHLSRGPSEASQQLHWFRLVTLNIMSVHICRGGVVKVYNHHVNQRGDSVITSAGVNNNETLVKIASSRCKHCSWLLCSLRYAATNETTKCLLRKGYKLKNSGRARGARHVIGERKHGRNENAHKILDRNSCGKR